MQKIIIGSNWYEVNQGEYDSDSTAKVLKVNTDLGTVKALFNNDCGIYVNTIPMQSFLNDFVSEDKIIK